MSEIKRMNIAEFRREGYLQELNRWFLHPRGLALEIVCNDDGSESIGGVWDCRDDPEGMIYGGDVPSLPDFHAKAERQLAILKERIPVREAALGCWIQPLAEQAQQGREDAA